MKLLRFPELKDHGIPFCRMHVDRLEKAGKFPRRVKVGANTVAWVETEIDDHVKTIVGAREGTHAGA